MKTDLKVRPNKIVAGLEPTETNILLQTIAKGIDRKIDMTDYVTKVTSDKVNIKDKTVKKGSKRDQKLASNHDAKTESVGSTHPDRLKSKNKKTEKNYNLQEKLIKENENFIKLGENLINEVVKDEKGDKLPQSTEIGKTNVPKDSPENSRGHEPISKELAEEVATEEQKSKPNVLKKQNSIILNRPKSAKPKNDNSTLLPDEGEAASAEEEEKETNENNTLMDMKNAVLLKRPKSSLRPPSVRPSSARPGAPRLRSDSSLPFSESIPMGNIQVIVENFDPSGADDAEMVVIQDVLENVREDSSNTTELLEITADNKGQLVEKILEQIEESEDDGFKKKIDIDWEYEGSKGRDATTKELSQLRVLIQKLTSTANPLGKLMHYLHEDLDAMYNEVQTWSNTKRQLSVEIAKEKKANIEFNKPLFLHLERLRGEVKKVEEQILITRGNILRNEEKIKELMSK
ncbi:TRAF3-interacting protein 1 isoform X2 [Cylas formicarius]|nr:TRAF3-interacting protein 1 isoform X2 [Cylas formicarius]